MENKYESWFIRKETWVPARIVASVFGLSERNLRGDDSPLRPFIISSDKGYKHIGQASDDEFDGYCTRIRNHAIAELKRVQYLRKRRTADRQQVLELQGELFV